MLIPIISRLEKDAPKIILIWIVFIVCMMIIFFKLEYIDYFYNFIRAELTELRINLQWCLIVIVCFRSLLFAPLLLIYDIFCLYYLWEDSFLNLNYNKKAPEEIDLSEFLSHDQPISLNIIKQIELGNDSVWKKNIERFNKMITQGIKKDASYVVSIEAPWGWGKTSFFWLYQQWHDEHVRNNSFAQNSSDTEPPRQDLKFYDYNPWMSQTSDFVRDFLQYVAQIIYTETGEYIFEDTTNYVKAIEGYMPSGLSELLPKNTKLSFQAEKQNLKQKIKNILQNKNIRIIIMVDNIDRFHESEKTLALLELVSEVSDLPYFTFIVPFDTKSVLGVIGDKFYNAEIYLQKMIDYRFRLLSENNYEHFKDYVFEKLFRVYQIVLCRDSEGEQYIVSNPDKIKLYEIIICEIFRFKYLTLLKEKVGYKVVPINNKWYVDFDKKYWSEMADLIYKKKKVWQARIKEEISSDDNIVYLHSNFSLPLRGETEPNILDRILTENGDYPDIYDREYFSLDYMFKAVEDIVSARLIKRILLELDFVFLPSGSHEQDNYKTLREAVKKALENHL